MEVDAGDLVRRRRAGEQDHALDEESNDEHRHYDGDSAPVFHRLPTVEPEEEPGGGEPPGYPRS